MHKHTLFTAVALTVAALVTTAAPAGAALADRGRFADEAYGFGYDCGFPMEVAGTASGNYRLRDVGDGAFLALDRVAFREVHTNTDTGEWFVMSGRFANVETGARHVEGTLFEVRVVKAGQIAVITNAEGDVVARDRGALRRTVLFDTGGDAEPGGEVVDLIDLDLAGPHESFGRLCEFAEELTSHA